MTLTAESCQIPAADRFGPWRDGIDPTERVARLRTMRAVAHLVCGPRGDAFADALHQAERDPAHLPAALIALDGLAALDRRRILASYAAINRPA